MLCRVFNRLIILLAITLMASAAVYAVSPFDVYLKEVTNNVFPDETAIFTLTLTNNLEVEDNYRFYLEGLSWNLQTDPLSDYLSGVTIPAHNIHEVNLKLKPIGSLDYGTYQLELKVDSQASKNSKSVFLIINLRNPHPPIKEYFAVVSKIVEIPAVIDPRETVPIGINLENLNPKNITNLEVQLSGKLINEQTTSSLAPLEKKKITFQVNLDPLTPPQKDTLVLTLLVDGRVLQPIIKELFEVMEYSEIVKELQPIEKSFLSTKQTIKFTNNGNVEKIYTHEQKVGFFEDLFTSSDPKAYKIKKDDATYLAWDLQLAPEQTQSVTVTTSYVPLFVLILIVILAIIAYYIFRSPITVTKEASILATKEGGISNLKVILHVKNRSNQVMDNVAIVDRVPNISEIEKEPELGSIKPTQILQSAKEGTVVKWEIGSLEKLEERIITYRIKSKLTIIGGVNLPSATVKFTDNRGKEQVANSNRLDVSI